MDPELYKLSLEVVSDAIKILGPALITAVVGYKAGKSQLLLRIEEINRNNEFKAREKIFSFHKEKIEKLDESILKLNEGLGQFSGMIMAGQDDECHFASLVNRYLSSYIDGLPFSLTHIEDELEKYEREFPREVSRLRALQSDIELVKKPTTPDEAQASIVKLLDIYGFYSHCLRLLVEKEAMQIFEPYTGNA